ncbi:hypothetical protein CYMTET_3709 [Cymbomonas tetramitiformis]|uniref:Reverse transcriptase domain-containing protein n=1 Tax=Cymbomonas tetramitiformis TaxID=36881 RepID=A0AAE0LL85_9CHLO|nr:hypothetical protein CYMTET_3709 [Cymbomonas tetramitiformis]
MLGQKDEHGVEHIWVAINRSLSKTEKQYASFQGEMLAVVWAVRTLRPYLHVVHFTLVTDHSPSTTLMEKADLQGQHLQWAIALQARCLADRKSYTNVSPRPSSRRLWAPPKLRFHQIPRASDEDRDTTTFWWGNQLSYRYTSMPFGAAGATAAFIRVMDYELRALTHCTVAYVDDIVIYSDAAEQHLKDVEAVLRTFGDARWDQAPLGQGGPQTGQ